MRTIIVNKIFVYYCGMYNFEKKIRVRYAETDQMGYVYYGVYAQYFEVGRVELLRELGVTYRKLEEDGFLLPVSYMNVKYIKPALYDDVLRIKTSLTKSESSRLRFSYMIYNSKNDLINTAEVELVFVSKKSLKPCKPPAIFSDKLKI